jgi:excisionase family DNA binding protein
MKASHKTLSVAQAAELCGVNRNTVGLWIRSGKLPAYRIGKKYTIPVEELIFFLKSSGQNIPEALGGKNLRGPFFKTINNCWDYFQNETTDRDCKNCTVFKNQLGVCFIGKASSALQCGGLCDGCEYYQETYFSRIQFIHQIDFPAAVCKDLYFWGGNSWWAKLCEVQEKDLVGMGIEKICHPDSLEKVISNNKKRALGDHSVPRTDCIYLKNSKYDKIKVQIAIYPLKEPFGAWLLLAEPT